MNIGRNPQGKKCIVDLVICEEHRKNKETEFVSVILCDLCSETAAYEVDDLQPIAVVQFS